MKLSKLNRPLQLHASVPANSIAYQRHEWTRSAQESFRDLPLQRKMHVIDGFCNRFPDTSLLFMIIVIRLTSQTFNGHHAMVSLSSVFTHAAAIIFDENHRSVKASYAKSAKLTSLHRRPILCGSVSDILANLPDQEALHLYADRNGGRLQKMKSKSSAPSSCAVSAQIMMAHTFSRTHLTAARSTLLSNVAFTTVSNATTGSKYVSGYLSL